jgi:hypothetical protein
LRIAAFGLPAFIIGLPLIAIEWPTAQAKRALLIVDDLDRCPADQMLDIVECLQLFLDDDAVASRLQVCMMIEDEILQAALQKKYARYFAKHGSDGVAPRTPAEQDRLRRRVIEENLEKLFLIHLRLAPVGTPKLQEIMRRYCRLRIPASPQPADDIEVGLEQGDDVTLGVESSDDSDFAEVELSDAPLPVDAELTQVESLLLEDAVVKMESSDYAGRWGPRSIRKFVLRYQLARMLLAELGQDVSPDELINELLRPRADNDQPADNALALVRSVVRQVA